MRLFEIKHRLVLNSDPRAESGSRVTEEFTKPTRFAELVQLYHDGSGDVSSFWIDPTTTQE